MFFPVPVSYRSQQLIRDAINNSWSRALDPDMTGKVSTSPFSSPTAAIVIAGWRRGCRAAGVARAAPVRHRSRALPPAGLGSSGFGLGALVGWWGSSSNPNPREMGQGCLGPRRGGLYWLLGDLGAVVTQLAAVRH